MCKIFKIFFIIIFLISFLNKLNAEPMIVLEFNSSPSFQKGDEKNEFFLNENHFEKYLIRPGDTLASIQKKFYNGSGLNSHIVQLSIIILNPHAFVKNNPNFMYSKKELYLPGKKNIEDLLIGKIIKENNDLKEETSEKIFFFGG